MVKRKMFLRLTVYQASSTAEPAVIAPGGMNADSKCSDA
jgi:hypothetical protein